MNKPLCFDRDFQDLVSESSTYLFNTIPGNDLHDLKTLEIAAALENTLTIAEDEFGTTLDIVEVIFNIDELREKIVEIFIAYPSYFKFPDDLDDDLPEVVLKANNQEITCQLVPFD